MSAISAANPIEGRAARYALLLDDMVEAGVDIVQDLRPSQSPDIAGLDRATGYDRATRRCMLLAIKFETDIQAPAPRIVARKQIIREVEDAIDRATRDPARVDALRAELQDRLDSPDLEDDIASQPAPNLIAEFCRDLGLVATLPGTTPYMRRTPADIAGLCARAAQPPITRPEPTPHHPNSPPSPPTQKPPH